MPMPMPMSVALIILTCFVVVSVDDFVVVSVVEGHLFNTFLFYIFKISSKMEKRSTISQSLTHSSLLLPRSHFSNCLL